MHTLRRAMVRPERELLSGVVELDEAFIGNESRGRAGDVPNRTAAMIAIESIPGRKLGRVRIELAGPARATSILSFADRVIAKGSLVRTDGASYFKRLPAAGYEHQAFVGMDSLEPAHVSLPGVHMISSQSRTSLLPIAATGRENRSASTRRITQSPLLVKLQIIWRSSFDDGPVPAAGRPVGLGFQWPWQHLNFRSCRGSTERSSPAWFWHTG